MNRQFVAHVPGDLYHGTASPDLLSGLCPPAVECSWWSRSSWDDYHTWMDGGSLGDNQIPYANIIWDQLRLWEKGRPNTPTWAKKVRSFDQLGTTVGLLFASADPEYASQYGEVFNIDLSAEQVLDVVHDPHVRSNSAWIILLKAGEPFPVYKPTLGLHR